MKVHNIMEEYVSKRVGSMYEDLKRQDASIVTCDCEDCRLDVTAYVLNHIAPRYVVSGRGVNHAVNALTTAQARSDVDVMIMSGIRVINSLQRPYHKSNVSDAALAGGVKNSPAFHFPCFIGNVYDGNTFEPLFDVDVLLKCGGDAAPMLDKTWANPCRTYRATNGVYSFYVKPQEAKGEGEAKTFTFTVEASLKDYEAALHSFSLSLSSKIKNVQTHSYSLKVQDLFLFRK